MRGRVGWSFVLAVRFLINVSNVQLINITISNSLNSTLKQDRKQLTPANKTGNNCHLQTRQETIDTCKQDKKQLAPANKTGKQLAPANKTGNTWHLLATNPIALEKTIHTGSFSHHSLRFHPTSFFYLEGTYVCTLSPFIITHHTLRHVITHHTLRHVTTHVIHSDM